MLRKSSGAFDIDCPSCLGGGIHVKSKPIKYDIFSKKTGKRKRVAKTLEEANNIIFQLGDRYEICKREVPVTCNIWVNSLNDKNVKFYDGLNLEEAIGHLPEMMKFIKKHKSY